MSLALAKLEKKTALQILVYLFKEKEPAKREELRDNIKGVMETIYSALENLRSMDLIEEEEIGVFPFERRVWLRERGMLVAKRLVEIEDILKTVE
jgi:predicted transcriptional regulator